MEQADRILDLLTEHWKIITTVLTFLVAGGYLVARYRTSGMRKLLAAHSGILDDLSARLGALRIELDDTRRELSAARAKGYAAASEVARLQERVAHLEDRETFLLQQVANAENKTKNDV